MQTKVFATTALLALVAGTEAARQKPYMVARAPESALNGLMRRSYDGYTPETELCGDGKTCSEACGAGYEQCASNDSNNHCFNPTVGDTCCGVNSGDSCETGFYCAHDSNSNTICCPENLDLKDCAAALSPNDVLTSDFPAAPTAAPTTTTAVEEPKPTDPVVEAPKPTDPVVEAPKPTDPVVVGSSTYLVIQTSSSLGAAPTDSPHDPVQSSSGTPPSPTGLPEGAASGIQATLGLAAAALFVALF